MKFLEKYHALLLSVGYLLLLSLKENVGTLELVALSFLFIYTLVKSYFDYNTLPDIRKEVDSKIEAYHIENKSSLDMIKKVCDSAVIQINEEQKEIKSKISSYLSSKSIGMSNSNIRF
jgi:Fe2+ transport system protein B